MSNWHILKSKTFWAFATVGGSISGGVAFDRIQARRLYQSYMEEARRYGSEPLPDFQNPRRLALLLLTSSFQESQSVKDNFRRFSVELLTMAGVDYKWIVDLNAEQVTKNWNKLAQEANQPEAMLDEGKIASLADIQQNIIVPLLKNHFSAGTVSCASQFWQRLLTQSDSADWPHPAEGYVALNEITDKLLRHEILEIILENEHQRLQPQSSLTTATNRSWLSWLTKSEEPSISKSSATPPVFLLDRLPCQHSQGAFARLGRFLFGQRRLTEEIGSATMKIIRDNRQSSTDSSSIQVYL